MSAVAGGGALALPEPGVAGAGAGWWVVGVATVGCELASLRQGDSKALLAYERSSTQGSTNDALNDRALYRPEWFISYPSTHPLS